MVDFDESYILVALSITKDIFPLCSDMQSFLLISRHKTHV